MMSIRHDHFSARGHLWLDETVVDLADADAVFDIAKLISDRVQMEPSAILSALRAPAGESVLAVLCRAAGLRVNAYSAVLRLRRRQFQCSPASPAEALAAYLELTHEAAERGLRLVKVGELPGRPE